MSTSPALATCRRVAAATCDHLEVAGQATAADGSTRCRLLLHTTGTDHPVAVDAHALPDGDTFFTTGQPGADGTCRRLNALLYAADPANAAVVGHVDLATACDVLGEHVAQQLLDDKALAAARTHGTSAGDAALDDLVTAAASDRVRTLRLPVLRGQAGDRFEHALAVALRHPV